MVFGHSMGAQIHGKFNHWGLHNFDHMLWLHGHSRSVLSNRRTVGAIFYLFQESELHIKSWHFALVTKYSSCQQRTVVCWRQPNYDKISCFVFKKKNWFESSVQNRKGFESLPFGPFSRLNTNQCKDRMSMLSHIYNRKVIFHLHCTCTTVHHGH